MTEEEHIAHIGTRDVWGQQLPFGLSAKDRRQHLYVIGKTGSGKTTLLRNMILEDIAAGHGVGVIDPHGDLAFDLLDHIPPWRSNDVVYFDAADRDYPIAMNLLYGVPADSRSLVASGIVSIFKNIWRDSWGTRLEYILYGCVAALLECQNVSLLGIQRMLVDANYRSWIVKQITDPILKSFWVDEFANYDRRFLLEAIAPIQNKVGQLLMAPVVRNILGQVKTRLNPRYLMDHRGIFIANLSKGRIGEDKSNLLGAVLITQFQLAAMSRAMIDEQDRIDFQLYVDEFQNFSTDSFASVLSESRKYRLSLTLSHQYINQLSTEVRDAVFGNVGSQVAFKVGETDAAVLAREFGGGYSPRTFIDLDRYEVCVKLLADGRYGEPFLGKTLPPSACRYGRRENLIKRSRERYGTSRRVVEDKIQRWMAR